MNVNYAATLRAVLACAKGLLASPTVGGLAIRVPNDQAEVGSSWITLEEGFFTQAQAAERLLPEGKYRQITVKAHQNIGGEDHDLVFVATLVEGSSGKASPLTWVWQAWFTDETSQRKRVFCCNELSPGVISLPFNNLKATAVTFEQMKLIGAHPSGLVEDKLLREAILFVEAMLELCQR